jgi:hypothetical protein
MAVAAWPRPDRRPAPIITGAAGAAALLAGGTIHLAALDRFDDLPTGCPCEPDMYSGGRRRRT